MSFFTLPASQRKRKRKEDGDRPPTSKKQKAGGTLQHTTHAQKKRDESISGSDSERDEPRAPAGNSSDRVSDSDSELEGETAAEKRLRLAERYLENIREEVDEAGFDAADIDKDLIAERLKEDVAETKGRMYRRIASDLSLHTASRCFFRADTQSLTAIATCHPYIYTASKDIILTKWEILGFDEPSSHPVLNPTTNSGIQPARPSRRLKPKQMAFRRGNRKKAKDPKYKGHTSQILAIAASADGNFVVTGGADRRLIVWDAPNLKPLRVFTQHRDAVTGLAFRQGTNQLYSCSKDRSVKVWSLNELAYVETLFGHQDEVVDIAAFAQERCVSVGARDRTARLWKVVEEQQLIFRGGGGGGGGGKEAKSRSANKDVACVEGSTDRVAVIDEQTFVTGSDNGSISLWSLQKKKPVFILPLAHGIDPPLSPEELSANQDKTVIKPNPPLPRWITALATVPYSDLVLSGSWDGCIRAWRISEDKRKVEAVGIVGEVIVGEEEEPDENQDRAKDPKSHQENQSNKLIRGVINDIAVFEKGDRGKDGICIVAAFGKEHRLGRWKKVQGKNGAVVFHVPRKASVKISSLVNGNLMDGEDGGGEEAGATK